MYDAATCIRTLHNGGLQSGCISCIIKENTCTFTKATTGAYKRFPVIVTHVRTFGKQQEFDGPTCLSALSKQACRYDAALVSDEQIAGAQVVADVMEVPMSQRSRGALHDEQA